MRWILLAIALLLQGATSPTENAGPPCLLEHGQMPASWLPSPGIREQLDPAPWSESEANDARLAIESSVDEMIAYFKAKPSAVQTLGDDSIEALIQATYASANKPEFDAKIRGAARENLTALIAPYLSADQESANCAEFDRLLPLAIFAHRLYPAKDPRTQVITKRANAAYRACGSLKAATKFDFLEVLADAEADPRDLFELYVWSLWFIEAELYPDIELPAETREYGRALWKYFQTYQFPNASDYEDGAQDDEFIEIADLASHISHIPTGTHRYAIIVEDSPDLYRFHRENFYAVLELGELDLLASFVDVLRQYGCTPANDAQVRDGTRHLLKVYHGLNDRWMDYRQEGESDADLDDYGLIHYPWTVVLGLRDRQMELPKPGTYGGIVRRWLAHP